MCFKHLALYVVIGVQTAAVVVPVLSYINSNDVDIPRFDQLKVIISLAVGVPGLLYQLCNFGII